MQVYDSCASRIPRLVGHLEQGQLRELELPEGLHNAMQTRLAQFGQTLFEVLTF
jgi:hypothetical protein